MKKYLLSLGLSISLVNSVFGGTASVTIKGNTFTNLLSFGPNFGSAVVKSVIIAAATSTNTVVTLIDTPTNQLVYTWQQYTNRGSYATNYFTTWTNFYGVVQTNYYGSIGGTGTNIVLVDYTNTVPAGTNSYPARVTIAAPGGNTITYSGVNTYFDQGIWATNASVGDAVITINY